jgi:tRNA pseudouridine55 synthase
MTSHDVVAITRRKAGTRKVGHAGTLDPMATGLLVLGLNGSTRLLTYIVGADKEYLATIRLGQSTTTDDAEGETLAMASTEALAIVQDEAIARGIAKLTGDIVQTPSSVSAIKVNGKRAYDLVREGVEVELKSRPVTVREFELLSKVSGTTEAGEPFIDLGVRVVCTSGTYIRALARDLGAGLGVGGHLTMLRRTRIGPFATTAASTLDDLDVEAQLRSPVSVVELLFDVLKLTEEQTVDLGHGKRILVPGRADAEQMAAVSPGERLIGLVSVAGGVARTLINFPEDAQ